MEEKVMRNTALGAKNRIIFISDAHRKIDSIYDFKSGNIKAECLHESWQTSGNVKEVRMAVNDSGNIKKQLGECKLYTVGELFCCAYASFFWQVVQIRYPEYALEA